MKQMPKNIISFQLTFKYEKCHLEQKKKHFILTHASDQIKSNILYSDKNTFIWLPFKQYQLVLSWYLHQPDSHQFSL